jgi:hypothetical protein
VRRSWITLDREVIWWRICSRSARRLDTGSVASFVAVVGPVEGVVVAVASPVWPFNAYSILRSRASSRSMVSVAVLSKVVSREAMAVESLCRC